MRVDVPLVRGLTEQVEVPERDPRHQEWLDGGLTSQPSALGARRKPELESRREERPVLDRLEEQELVLDLDVAGACRALALARLGEDRGNLELELPPRQQGQLERRSQLAPAPLVALVMPRAELELALDHGPARDQRVEEFEARLVVGPEGDRRREDEDESRERMRIRAMRTSGQGSPHSLAGGVHARHGPAGWVRLLRQDELVRARDAQSILRVTMRDDDLAPPREQLDRRQRPGRGRLRCRPPCLIRRPHGKRPDAGRRKNRAPAPNT